MRAIILKEFGSSDNFQLKEVATPLVEKDFVLVKIMATAFNPVDYQIRSGMGEKKLLHSPILGREFSGVVVSTGSDVLNFKKGDEVFAYSSSLGSNGTYAEYISVPYQILAHKPPGISFEEAAGIPLTGLTAWQCFQRLNISGDQSLFITGGAGGVGTIFIKLLLSHGIHRIVTTAGNEESIRHLQETGLPAKQIIDYTEPGLLQRIVAANGQQHFDICVDLVGHNMSKLCSTVIKTNGVYADVTNFTTAPAREQLFDKGAVIYNISNYAYAINGQRESIAYYGKHLQQLSDMISSGTITPPAIFKSGDFSVASVQTAHSMLENNQSKGRKIVMTVSQFIDN